jgi:hypothetical protein
VSQLRGFLGLVQYYDAFMDHFADVAYPLTELLKKDVPWIWEGPQIQAFDAMKDLVSTPPCLLMPDFDKPFVLHVDASDLLWELFYSRIRDFDCSQSPLQETPAP